MNRRIIIIGAVGLILAGVSIAGVIGWLSEHQRADELEELVHEMQQEVRQSAVDRSVSKQMEEIAYQQKEISDEQRAEAEQQTLFAQEMQKRSEEERQNALEAEKKAVASERQAQDARQLAENQRQLAEQQRIQAEHSKRVADTLSYIALGRSLGSQSSIQAQSGNTDLANLLAYSSYLFTRRYGGDVYYPAVFQSLMDASQSKRTWSFHNAPVVALASMPKGNDGMVTASTYGALMIHKWQDGRVSSTTLLSNSQYDFRDVYVGSNSVIYAISRSGHLVVVKNGHLSVITLDGVRRPVALSELDAHHLLIVGDRAIASFDMNSEMMVKVKDLDFKITSTSRYDNHPLLFDDRGRQHLVKSLDDVETSKIPVAGRVTAFASSKNSHVKAYGMSDGSICLVNELTNTSTMLLGHLSQVSKLKLNGLRLFSSSYDGSVRLWNTASTKIEPMTLLSLNAWIMNFTFDNSKNYIWTGDQNGNVTMALLSIPMMVETLSKNIKRDFTTDEWNYYVGRNVPKESLMNRKGE